LRSFISPGRGLEQLPADAKRVPRPFFGAPHARHYAEPSARHARHAAIPIFVLYLFDSARGDDRVGNRSF